MQKYISHWLLILIFAGFILNLNKINNGTFLSQLIIFVLLFSQMFLTGLNFNERNIYFTREASSDVMHRVLSRIVSIKLIVTIPTVCVCERERMITRRNERGRERKSERKRGGATGVNKEREGDRDRKREKELVVER